MLAHLHKKPTLQKCIGLAAGILFGFLLHKGGVTHYDVILGQLLLQDFTVVKVMLTAVITGMLGVHLLVSLGWATLHPKPGTVGTTVIGGLIFGFGFALLGYCPGTVAGAVGNGRLDALVGGVPGILLGTQLFAILYPALETRLLSKGDFGDITVPTLLKVNPWTVVLPVAALLAVLLWIMEKTGL